MLLASLLYAVITSPCGWVEFGDLFAGCIFQCWEPVFVESLKVNEEIEIPTYFVCFGSIINSNGDCSQEIRSLRRAAMKELEQIIKYKAVSLETMAKILHTFVFLITMYGCESWTV